MAEPIPSRSTTRTNSLPNLDDIVVGDSPVDSFRISGSVKDSDGAPLAGVEVFLSGQFMQMKTVTDAQGGYEFTFLPKGDYYVRPQSPETFFSPYETVLLGIAPQTRATRTLPRRN